MKIRKAVLAGSWYPGSAQACEREIANFLQEDEAQTPPQGNFVGGIVPHAGWFYSGSIACRVIHCLSRTQAPEVFAVFGMHLRPSDPKYITARGAWETPFGAIPIAEDIAAQLIERFDFEIETAESFIQDNTIELQLPFLKYFNEDVRIVPMGVPPTDQSLEVGKAVVGIAAAAGLRLKVLGSTDLTHYGTNYGFTPRGMGRSAVNWVREDNDRRVIDAMVAMDSEKVLAEGTSKHNACCSGAAATAIAASARMGAKAGQPVAYATSYDKSPGESFVGYVGIVY